MLSDASDHFSNHGKSTHVESRKAVFRSKRIWPALSIPKLLIVKVFIEIFCGCAKLSRHIARLGQTCLIWDINLGAEYDLTARKQQLVILGWISAGLVSGVHLGTPCNSFSRARDSGPGPPRLRSDSHPLGLPSLWRLGDIQAVNVGNRLMRFSAQVLRACLNARVPATLENPRLSRLWLCPPIASISRLQVFSFHIVDFCMFGTPWEKPIGILSFSLNLDSADSFRCLGMPRGVCERTGCRHHILRGCDASGIFHTKLAESYPDKFCRFPAQAYDNFWVQQVADSFGRFF